MVNKQLISKSSIEPPKEGQKKEYKPNTDMANEIEFEKVWELAKEWEALPPEEKERRRKMYDDGFYERISDDPTGAHDEDC